jgi:anti-sigma factor RsiW
MSQTKELIKDQQLVNYLLGLLPEAEAESLDEASITDDEVAARLCGIEEDLIDAYVLERLDQDTRARFEAFYLTSPRRRDKVKFAKRFLAAVDRAALPGITPIVVTRSSSENVRRFPLKPDAAKPATLRSRYNWPLLTTAASVVLACGVMVNDLQLRQGLNKARRLSASQDQRAESLTEQLNQARSENVEIAQALERARGAALQGERPRADLSPAASDSLALAMTTATVLFPQTRSIGAVTAIDIPAGVEAVPFQLRLESNEFTQYRAVLKDPDTNRTVWRSAALHARSAAQASVSLVVPANTFESQHYSFELAGLDAAGHETTTGTYAVQIERR